MKKLILALLISVILGIYSPGVVRSLTESTIRVRNSVSQDFLANAFVMLFTNTSQPVYYDYTDGSGSIYIDELFELFQTNSLYMTYDISKPGYINEVGAKDFHYGDTTILEVTPEVYCGDDVCTPYEEDILSCPEDCSVCGDDRCSIPVENHINCPLDCEEEYYPCRCLPGKPCDCPYIIQEANDLPVLR